MGVFAGKVAIVTGAGSGLGAAIAQKFAHEGGAVAVVDLVGDNVKEVVGLITAAGGKAIGVTADVSSEADNQRMFDEAEKAFGKVDYAVLNAAMHPWSIEFKDITLDLFDRVIGVNLRSVFMGLKLAHDRLNKGGAVVATASLAGIMGHPDGAAYSASKHGVIGLVKSAARNFGARGLRVNAICPGHLLTPMAGLERDVSVDFNAVHENVPYKGGMTPSQVADFVLFLIGPGATALNGQAHIIDAGMSSGMGD